MDEVEHLGLEENGTFLGNSNSLCCLNIFGLMLCLVSSGSGVQIIKLKNKPLALTKGNDPDFLVWCGRFKLNCQCALDLEEFNKPWVLCQRSCGQMQLRGFVFHCCS